MRLVPLVWQLLGHISIVHWLWTLVPAGLAALVTGGLAYLNGQPAWVIFLAALVALAIAMMIAAAFEHWRASRARAKTIKAATTYDAELARLRALDRAKEQVEREALVRRSAKGSSFDLTEYVADIAEEARLDRKARRAAERRKKYGAPEDK